VVNDPQMKIFQYDNLAKILIFGTAMLLVTLLYQPDAHAKSVTASTAQTRVTKSFKNALKAYRNNDFARAYYWGKPDMPRRNQI